VLGSTGSIGRNTLEVIAENPDRLRLVGISACHRLDELARQANRFRPRWAIAADPAAAERRDWSDLPRETKLLVGPEGIEQAASDGEVDLVVAAIVGSAGLAGTLAAIEAGKRVALANKETLVMAGSLVMEAARRSGATILPVDSEHSAVFQALHAGRREDVRRIILTASGGPFRNHTLEQLAHVTIDDALAHPTWDMGPKITVDSATMMNKALEIIEARWLFDLSPDQIDVVVHPQSIVHSLVEFVDGSTIAQLSRPDMRLPIQYALAYPARWPCSAERLDLGQSLSLDFEPPDFERFDALALGLKAAADGGTAGAALNGANEAAVAAFLAGELQFNEITPACRQALERHPFDPSPTLEQLHRVDQMAREEIARWALT
jgi:1-deoxy-D-xylulose-5-phosphate reductoisomerase